jgi:hypothetical protein
VKHGLTSNCCVVHTVPLALDQHPPWLLTPRLCHMPPAAFGASCASSLRCSHHAWRSPRTDPPHVWYLSALHWSGERERQILGSGNSMSNSTIDGLSSKPDHAGAYPHHLWLTFSFEQSVWVESFPKVKVNRTKSLVYSFWHGGDYFECIIFVFISVAVMASILFTFRP